jgi:hypothetical protein
MYYRCVVCWALTSSAYLDFEGDKCSNCGAGLMDRHAPMVDVATLPSHHQAQKGVSQGGTVLVAEPYDSDGIHCGSWYRRFEPLKTTILPTPVAIVQSKGPGDALRFLHAATRLLSNVCSRTGSLVEMTCFLEEAYARHIVGLYSGSKHTLVSISNEAVVYREEVGPSCAIRWVVFRRLSVSDSIPSFTDFVNGALALLEEEEYRWYSPTNAVPLFLEPYHGKTRHYRYAGVQFARIDLDAALMDSGYLAIPHRQLRSIARPPNTVRVLLYLRNQGDGRDTPWGHLRALRELQQTFATTTSIVVTLAGMKDQKDYHAALAAIAPEDEKTKVSNTVLYDWGWSTYCYQAQSFQEQLATINGSYDVAVGINTSALDLAAAAGCVVLRDAEWKQGEYEGESYNRFLLAEATFGIFAYTAEDRRFLFRIYLDGILNGPFRLAATYRKLTVRSTNRAREPREEVIGTLQ